MKALKSLFLAAVLLVSGCATLPASVTNPCERHPVACTVAGAIVAGSVAATIEQHHRVERRHFDPNCADGVIGSDFDPACHKGTPGIQVPFVHPIGP
jgi:hypothetical protein